MDAISHWVLVSEWHVTGDTAAATACRQTIPPGTPNQLIHTGPDLNPGATPRCASCSTRAEPLTDTAPQRTIDEPHWVLITKWHATAPAAATTACRQNIPPATSQHPDWYTGTDTDATPVCTTCSVRAPLSGDLTPRESADYMQLDAIQRGVYTRLPPSQRALYAKRQASRARATALAAAETGARSIIHTSRSVHTVNGGLPGHGKRY